MKLRFEIDQSWCLRNGINAPKSIVHCDVDPKMLTPPERNMIADRMDGIDVVALDADGSKTKQRIMAKTPDFKGLFEAVQENDNWVRKQKNAKKPTQT